MRSTVLGSVDLGHRRLDRAGRASTGDGRPAAGRSCGSV